MSEINQLKNPNDTEKRRLLSLSFSILFTVIYLILVAVLINEIYKPDVKSITNEVKNLISPTIWSLFIANMSEHPTANVEFIISLLLLPILLTSFYIIFNWIFNNLNTHKINFLYVFVNIIQIILLLFSIYFISKSGGFFFAKYLFAKKSFWIYTLIIFPIFILIQIYYKRIFLFKKIVNILSIIIIGLILFAVFFMNIFNTNAYWGAAWHLNSVFYSLSQVVEGKTLIVDFLNQYGLYPHFLNPIFQITGLSILKFSIVLSSLNIISFVLIYIALYKIVQNKFILFLGFCTMILINYLIVHGLWYYDVYFQYFPIRALFPALLIFFSVFYLKFQSKLIYFLSFPLFLAGILWNQETGIIVLVGWMLFLSFYEFAKTNSLKNKINNISKHILVLIAFIIIITLLLVLWFYTRIGHVPDLSKYFIYQKFFYFIGFAASEKPLIHEWNIVILIYIYGLAVSIKSLFDKKHDSYYSIVFLLSILGLGLFSYYQGHSHNFCFCFSSYPAILLLILIADNSFNEISIKKTKYYNVAYFTILFFFLGTGIFSIVKNSNIIRGWTVCGFKSLYNQDANSDFSQNIALIKKHVKEGEKILILSPKYDGLYYGETHTICVLNTPSYSELTFKTSYDMFINKIINNDNTKIFVDLIFTDQNFFYALIENNYGIKDISTNGKMLYVEKNSGSTLSVDNLNTQAFDVFQQMNIVKYNPSIENYFYLGTVLGENNQIEEAKEAYKRAIELDPSFVSAYVNLSFCCCKTGEWEEAIFYSKKALEINPNDELTLNNLNWALNSVKIK